MKKLLSMALVLMMLCALFAVPAMADEVAVYDQIIGGDFEAFSIGAGASHLDPLANGFQIMEIGTSFTVVEKDGSKVLKAPAKTTGITTIKSDTILFDVEKGKPTIKFDMYLETDPSVTELTFKRASINDAGFGLDAEGLFEYQCLYRDNGWKNTPLTVTDRATGEAIDIAPDFWKKGLKGTFPTNKWVSVSFVLQINATGDGRLNFVAPAFEGNFYLDNVAVEYSNALTELAVTEYNGDYGTVYGPVAVAAGSKVQVIPNPGYYLHTAVLDGVDVTASFVRTGELGRQNDLVYTATIASGQNLVITYAQYDTTVLYSQNFEENTDISNGDVAAWEMLRSDEQNNTADGGYSLKFSSIETGTAGEYIQNTKLGVLDLTYVAGGEDFAAANVFYMVEFDTYVGGENPTVGAAMSLYGTGRAPKRATNSSTAVNNIPYGNADGGKWTSYRIYASSQYGGSGRTEIYAPALYGEDGIAVGYIDNVKFTAMTKPATPIIPENGGAVEPEVEYAISVAPTANGTVTADAETAVEGAEVTFTIAPALGYYVSTAAINGVSILGDIDAYAEDTYTYTVGAEDAVIAVAFAKIADSAAELDVATLPGIFTGTVAEETTAIAFGVIDTEDDTIVEFGVEYKTAADADVVTAKGNGPKFAADAASEAGQYAVELQALPAGSYKATTYIKYANGDYKYGQTITFTIG